MTTKLIQKHLFKGTQEFEIIDDQVNVRIKSPFKKEELLTVMLTVLNSEPVISKSTLSFTSRVNSEALVTLYLAKPNAEEFNAFIALLKQKILDEYNAFAGLKVGNNNEALGRNVYDEPEAFDDLDQQAATKKAKDIDVGRLEETLLMLEQNFDTEDVKPLMASLTALKADPTNEAHLLEVISKFNELGSLQGAVLTYAPYVGLLMADDPFSF